MRLALFLCFLLAGFSWASFADRDCDFAEMVHEKSPIDIENRKNATQNIQNTIKQKKLSLQQTEQIRRGHEIKASLHEDTIFLDTANIQLIDALIESFKKGAKETLVQSENG